MTSRNSYLPKKYLEKKHLIQKFLILHRFERFERKYDIRKNCCETHAKSFKIINNERIGQRLEHCGGAQEVVGSNTVGRWAFSLLLAVRPYSGPSRRFIILAFSNDGKE